MISLPRRASLEACRTSCTEWNWEGRSPSQKFTSNPLVGAAFRVLTGPAKRPPGQAFAKSVAGDRLRRRAEESITPYRRPAARRWMQFAGRLLVTFIRASSLVRRVREKQSREPGQILAASRGRRAHFSRHLLRNRRRESSTSRLPFRHGGRKVYAAARNWARSLSSGYSAAFSPMQ
jgi:hypothetical protein